MNALSYFSTGSASAIEPIEELRRVTIKRDFETRDGILPKGSSGTVVSVYDNGAAYCVEFTKPIQALLTVRCDEIAAV